MGLYDSTGTILQTSAVGQITLSLSPGGDISGTTTVGLSSGLASFTSLQILSAGTFTIIADGVGVNPGLSSSTYTITNTLLSLWLSSSTSSPGVGASFTVTVTLLGQDQSLYTSATTVTISEATGKAITGTTSYTTSSGTATFSISFASSGNMVLVGTSSSITGTLPVTVGTSYVTLTAATTPIVNCYVYLTSSLRDASGNLLSGSSTGTLSGNVGGTLTGTSTTGLITYYMYFTASSTQTVTVTQGGVTSSVPITVQTNTASIVPSADWGWEPSTLTYTVSLANQPVSSEVITISGSATQFTIAPSSLTFTSSNYATAQTVTVSILSASALGKWTSYIYHTDSNLGFASCSSAISSSGAFGVTIYNSQTQALLINNSPVMIEGASATYSIKLSVVPTASVTVSITATSSLSFSPTSLTFTTSNWGTYQVVTVTSKISNSNTNGANAVTITHKATSTDTKYAMATTIPSVVYAYVIRKTVAAIYISKDVVFQEYLGGEYFVWLGSPPKAQVNIALSTSGTTITFSPQVLTFTELNYYTPQSITLSSSITYSSRGLKYSITIVHTVTSADSNYNGISATPSSSIKVTALNPCSAGLYSWPPGSGTCAPCPLGYSCPTLWSDKVACSSSQFSLLGQWSCLPCPPGHSCTGLTSPLPCPSGTSSLWGVGVCSTCLGECDKNGQNIIAAPAGFYINNAGHSIYQCPPGYMCTGGTSAPVLCSSGTYAPIGSSTCLSCAAGSYCHTPSTPSPLLCSPYHYSSSAATKCTYCPVGYSCTSSAATACAAGTMSLEGWTQCVSVDYYSLGTGGPGCGGGYYQSAGACVLCTAGSECDGFLIRACAPGYYSAAGALACTACITGTYRNTPQATSCTTVSAGYIANLPYIGQFPCYRGTTPNSLNNACISCPSGSYCDTPATPTTCPAGYYCSPIGFTQFSGSNAAACPSGYYNPNTGASLITNCLSCPAGSYCPKGSSSVLACPKGHYCLQYSYLPDNFPCPIGTYSSLASQTSAAICLSCPIGHYCPQGYSINLPCIAGTYCPLGSNEPFWCASGYTSNSPYTQSSDCVQCLAGFYCPSGSLSNACPAGTYNSNVQGGFLWNACTPCTAGHSCSAIAMTVATTYACSAGSYCPMGTEFPDQYPCLAGTYTDSTGLTQASGCTACPAGYYCKIQSTSRQQVLCPRGNYCLASTGYSHQNMCPSGTFTWSLGNSAASSCASCTSGMYCVPGASYVSGYCALGAYCPAGTGLPDANLCAAGTFNAVYNATQASGCTNCPPGYYCLAGCGKPLPCPPGTYASAGQTTSYATCTTCSAGYYCGSGSTSQTICASGLYSPSGSSECSSCPSGSYCSSGIATACPSGYYCPLGASASTLCPAGYYCPSSSEEATPCQPGTYNPNTGASASTSCLNTPAGYYTILGSSTNTGYCEPGYYCLAGSAGPYATPCPAGTYVTSPGSTSLSSCLQCPAGYYCELGTAFPVICPISYYCVAGSSTPVFCPSGTIGSSVGLTASTSCSSCPSGSFCSQPGLGAATGNCATGYLCTTGSSSSTPTGSTCPAGGYCAPGFPTQRACPPGSYNPDTGAKDITWCGKCDAGYYCLGSETVAYANPCLAGYYCPVSSYWGKMQMSAPGYYSAAAAASETSCPIGTFNNLYAQNTCTQCTSGFYCASNAMTQPVVCPVGSYCPVSSSTYTSCPAGTFSPRKGVTQLSACTYCTAGMYCAMSSMTAASGLCDPGYFCTFGATTKQPVSSSTASGVYGPCAEGYYCPQGSPLSLACPSGTYQSAPLTYSASQCIPCTLGSYCTSTGLTSVQGACDQGYYCLLGTAVPRPTTGTENNYCTTGQYCPTGSSEATSCLAGTYQDENRQASCKNCPAGFYCLTGTTDYSSTVCPTGYYCPSSTEFITEYACSLGTYNPTLGLTTSAQCLQCPPGYSCRSSGKSMLIASDICNPGYFCKIGSKLQSPQSDMPGDSNGGKCVAGYYCPSGSVYGLDCDGGQYCSGGLLASTSGACSQGYYCVGKAVTSTPVDGITGNVCPAGFYCPAGTISPIPCPKGTYNSVTGKYLLAHCLNCPLGMYCGGVGLSSYTGACAAGYFCAGGNYELMPLLGGCPAGSYCPSGSSSANLCPSGYYQDQTNQASCKICPLGYFCSSSGLTSATLCGAGFYCPLGSSVEQACPAGTYSGIPGRGTVTNCINCPPGKYCLGGGAAPDGLCSAGYYCLSGAVSATPSIDAQGGICPRGYYCPLGSTSAILCTPGFYCASTGLSATSGPCQAGYYCEEGAHTATPRDGITGNICPTGYYCQAGASFPSPCAIGKYQTSQEQTSVAQCVQCPAGYYCNALAASGIPGVCSGGYYCVAGTLTATPASGICPAGSYCPPSSTAPTTCPGGTYQDQIGQAICKSCPRGFFCDAGSTLPTVCPAGYSCSGGSSSSTYAACEQGYYSPFPGQASCQVCPPGYYCGLGPVLVPAICPVASYCLQGTGTPVPTCLPGSYTDEEGLQEFTQCKLCPIGSYCINGVISGICTAGYYCASGSNTPTPDSYTNYGIAMPCPEGHYCLAGTLLPTPCPEGKFRISTGGVSVSDCTYCQAGYYCIPNDPTPKPCPTGAYCPVGSSSPLLCKTGFYSNAVQASSSSTCMKCPSGYVCTRPGAGDYSNFPCTPGYYCPYGSDLPVFSPAGYYSPGYSAGSLTDLLLCPAGFICSEFSTGYSLCSIGTYCPAGSSSPTSCPQGSFCDYQSGTPSACPMGWYCPHYTVAPQDYPPILCPEGSICPAGAINAYPCLAGQYAIMARGLSDTDTYCSGCPEGSFSYPQSTNCTVCDPGYICLGNSTIPNPTDIDLYSGYECPSGFFCPAGSASTYSCPLGTYSTSLGLSNMNQCTSCPEGTYSATSAATACVACGGSTNNMQGSSSCTCSSQTRVYLKSSQSCVCKAGYQYIDFNGDDLSDQDGAGDCSRIIYPRCAATQVRDELGNCRSASDCEASCGGKGLRNSGTGICQCQNIQDVNGVCDPACQQSSSTVSVTSQGLLAITDPSTGLQELVSPSEVQGLAGSMACASGNSCKMYSVDFSGGSFQGLYGVHPLLQQASGTSRRLDQTPSITNPVACLLIGESMMFTVVAPEHYPVYLSKSLANTNTDFDYSDFEGLATNITAGIEVQAFAFTFTEAGIYLFGDYSNTNTQMLVAVMDQSVQCPFGGANLQPRMLSSMHLVGMKLNTNIVLAVDWDVVYAIMGMVLGSFIILAGLFYYFTLCTWAIGKSGRIYYREENMELCVRVDEGTRTTVKIFVNGVEAPEEDSDTQELMEMVLEKVPEEASYELGIKKDRPIDAQFIESIKDKIRENNLKFLKILQENKKGNEKRLETLQEETCELQKTAKKLLEPISALARKIVVQEMIEEPQVYEEHVIASSQFQATYEEISTNPRIYEQDKNKLVSHLHLELSKIEKNIGADKSVYGESVTKRLEQRGQKRKELERDKQEIDLEKKEIIKKQQREIWELNKQFEDDELADSDYHESQKISLAKEFFGEAGIQCAERYVEMKRSNNYAKRECSETYKNALKELERNLSINQLKHYREACKRISQEKRQKEYSRKHRETTDFAELRTKHEEEIAIFKNRRSEFQINEVVSNVLSSTKDLNFDTEMEIFYQKQREDLLSVENEMIKAQESDIQKLHRQAELYEKKAAQEKASLEKQKREMMELLNSASDEEKEVLVNKIHSVDVLLKDALTRQDFEIEKRIQMRKIQTKERIREVVVKQEKEAEIAEEEIKQRINKEADRIFLQSLEEHLKNLPEASHQICLRKILVEKHETEFITLQKRLKSKLKLSMLKTTQKLMQLKMSEIENLRLSYREKLKLSQKSPDVQIQIQIQKEEIEAINRLDYEYLIKIENEQESQWKLIHEINKNELLVFLREQLTEARNVLGSASDFIPKMEEKFRQRTEIIENESKVKMDLFDKQKLEIESMKAKKQQELEEMIRQEKINEERIRQQEYMIEKRRTLIKKQRKERELLLSKGKVTAEHMELLIKEHQKELKLIEDAISKERNRQMANMSHKLAEKRSRKMEYEIRIKELAKDQEKWDKEIEQLPNFKNMQAKTLLLKWRKYPKKGLEDVRKSAIKNEVVRRNIPVVAPKPSKSVNLLNDRRLEEIAKRIEFIDNKITRANSEKMYRLMTILQSVQKKSKLLPKKSSK